MKKTFKSKVELEFHNFFKINKFAIESISTKDDGNFNALIYTSKPCLIQIYSSNRDGEVNCKLSLPESDTANSKEEGSSEKKWHFLNELLPDKQELTIEQLIAATPSTPKSEAEQLHELSVVLQSRFHEALATLQSLEQ